jgi:hypothetical protein
MGDQDDAAEPKRTAKNYFSQVKLHKGTDFPSLYREENGRVIKLEAGEGPAWHNRVTGWCGAHGLIAPFQIAEALFWLNDKGTKLLAAAIEERNDFGSNGQGMRHGLEQLSSTALGKSIMLPDKATISVMPNEEVHELFDGFARICTQLSFLLTTSATTKNCLITIMPEIFDSPDSASRKDGVTHEYVGLIQLVQVDKRLSRDPQGSALQQKTKLIAEIKEKAAKAISLHHIVTLIQDASMTLTNITQKQPSLKESTEMELNSAFCALLRASCRHVRDISKTGKLVDAAEVIANAMTIESTTLESKNWYNFGTDLLTLLGRHLPPESSATKTRDHVTDAIALLATEGIFVKKGGAP